MALRAKRATFILNELFVKKRALEKSVHSKKRALRKACTHKLIRSVSVFRKTIATLTVQDFHMFICKKCNV